MAATGVDELRLLLQVQTKLVQSVVTRLGFVRLERMGGCVCVCGGRMRTFDYVNPEDNLIFSNLLLNLLNRTNKRIRGN